MIFFPWGILELFPQKLWYLRRERMIAVKGFAITAGIGAAIGAIAILMMPRNNPTRRLAARAANKAQDVVFQAEDALKDLDF